MTKTTILLAFTVLCGCLQAQVPTDVTDSQNPVIEWNKTLLSIVRTPGAQPPTIHSTRNFAMMHVAMFDAVNDIAARYSPYLVRQSTEPRSASQVAAADQAAHDVLLALYPDFQSMLDAQLQDDLGQVADGLEKTSGILVGAKVASEVVAFRANDGSSIAPPPFKAGSAPGDYQLTPPNFAPADFRQWPDVDLFALARADEFQPAPPPELTCEEYVRAFNEVKNVGIAASTTRTADQTVIGKFWNGNIQDFWNEIAQTAAAAHHLSLIQSARLFALLNISLADTTISFFEAKYTYNFWRPVTAIRLAGGDNDSRTQADPNWLPLTTKTAPDPSYPGAHSAISFAGAEVLRAYFGDRFIFDVTSESLPDVTRHFTSFTAAAEEAGLSRIYAGQHFRTDHKAGKLLGEQVAESVIETTLLPR